MRRSNSAREYAKGRASGCASMLGRSFANSEAMRSTTCRATSIDAGRDSAFRMAL